MSLLSLQPGALSEPSDFFPSPHFLVHQSFSLHTILVIGNGYHKFLNLPNIFLQMLNNFVCFSSNPIYAIESVASQLASLPSQKNITGSFHYHYKIRMIQLKVVLPW